MRENRGVSAAGRKRITYYFNRVAPAALAAIGLTLTCAPAGMTRVFCSDGDGDSDIYAMKDGIRPDPSRDRIPLKR
jgi:hypothetical protein